MKFSKTTLLALMALFATSAFAQQQKAPAQTERPAQEEQKKDVATDTNEDRSYFADFETANASIVLFDENSKTETVVTVKSVGDSEIVFVGGGGELSVSKKKPSTLKVNVKTNSSAWKAARIAFGKGEWDAAVKNMRAEIYPLIPLMSLPSETFKGHVYLEGYIQALLNAERLIEAESIVAALPLADCPHDVISISLSVAERLIKTGKTKEAMAILERVPFTGEKIDNIPDMMNVLAELRKSGLIAECSLFYTKLMNVESPQKNEAAIWMIYCDLSLGKKMSADIYLNQIKLPNTSPEFSLLQMAKGMLAEKAAKPNFREVLDLYAEGIVFGSLASSWMPELLYNAGMAYKKLGKQYAANEIFAQMLAFYPDDVLTKKGQKEVVKIERKKKVSEDDEEDEEDEDEEE